MMGWQTGDQRQLFYLFNLERRIPASHLLRHLREKLAPFYSDIGTASAIFFAPPSNSARQAGLR